ncbi:accessory Sec system protein translocase subunit SecY2 [Facklamia sp. 7083-14-GEN3]|uniref:accessory Sec system protein translocase subunit SecY2 n=1 Tax=Facklamia sp. 7083-14-GEN3 TaxID=2973478 RepID=UPI00215C101B|nr:accessory Sec system protein translocase subunit SecY2 [Facklamia sp. 7083-14-GEN3]MCR8968373.1 accessory Sec system protein translocase subunit SecY2 [Facklamia sp. 7083-14-GEN3]
MKFYKNKDVFKKRGLNLLLILLFYRIGQLIPLPFIEPEFLKPLSEDSTYLNRISEMTGGQFENLSLLSLGLSPWMTTMIIWYVFTMNRRSELKRYPSRILDRYKYSLAFFLSIIQAWALILRLDAQAWITVNGLSITFVKVFVIIILTAGAFLMIWLANLNSRYGIGGLASLILVNILMRLITTFKEMANILLEQNNLALLLTIIVLSISLIPFWIIMDRIEIQYRLKRPMINNEFAQNVFVPIKLNTAGAMPIMFAYSFFMLPQNILKILSRIFPKNNEFASIGENLTLNHPFGIFIYLICLLLLIIAFAFIQFNPDDLSDKLLKNGDYIINLRPGKTTNHFLMRQLIKYSLIGGVFLIIITVAPLIVALRLEELNSFSMLPGTMFIVASLSLTIIEEMQLYRVIHHYNPLFPLETNINKKG